MKHSSRFFNPECLTILSRQTQLRASTSSSPNSNYPLLFNNVSEEKSKKSNGLWGFNKKYQAIFESLLKSLCEGQNKSKTSLSNEDNKKSGFFSSLFSSQKPKSSLNFQPKLLEKFKMNQTLKLQIDDIEKDVSFKETVLLQKTQVRGVFIHRNLNMPSSCYSVERNEGKRFITYRMKNKFQKSQDIEMFQRIKQEYETIIPNYRQQDDQITYQVYYMDGYDNFIKTEHILRQLVTVSVHIKGTLINRDGRVLSLPLNPQLPITTHTLQLETAEIPGRNQEYILTDIDNFMNENPHII